MSGMERPASRNPGNRNGQRNNGAAGGRQRGKNDGTVVRRGLEAGRIREGQCPVTKTDDYSDVVVVDADGRIIPWQRVARLDRAEMERTMREIVDRLYTVLRNMEAAEMAMLRKHREDETSQWSRPRENPGLKKQLEVIASGIVESGRKPGAEGSRERKEAGSGLRRRVGPAALGSRRTGWVEERGGGNVRVSVLTLGDERGDRVC